MSVLDNVLIGFLIFKHVTVLWSPILRFPRFLNEEKRIKERSMEILDYFGMSAYAHDKAVDPKLWTTT